VRRVSPRQEELFDKPRQHTKLPGDGYAASPGSGPKGETCSSCANCKKLGRFNKCGLVKRKWERSTDIRLDAPACLHWKPPT
jgi:hypothetical protein